MFRYSVNQLAFRLESLQSVAIDPAVAVTTSEICPVPARALPLRRLARKLHLKRIKSMTPIRLLALANG
jgi:hypothetical protein